MRRSAQLVASLALLLAAGCGSANEMPSGGFTNKVQPISGGQVDSTHSSVVGIAILPNGFQGPMEMCSGTLIAPNLVLTARHCVASVPSEQVICGQSTFGATYQPSAFYVSTDVKVGYSSNFTRAQEVRVPSNGADMCGYDVALLVLDSKITGVTPYVPRIDKEVALGEVYTAVGYGITTPTGQDSGTRRDRTGLHVSWYHDQSYAPVCNTQPCGGQMAPSEWEGETGVCQGDSGGPALDANNMVVGVTSRGYNCTYPIYSAVSTWKDFIIQGALDAAKKGGYTPPTWATTGSTGTGGAGGAGGATGAGGASGGTGGQATGGAGGTAGGPVTTADPQGEQCSSSQPCPSGYECVYDSDPSQAYCAARCDAQNACSPGLKCTSVTKSVQVCKNPPQSSNVNTSSGCTLGEGRGPAKPVPWIIGLSLIGLAGVRRRRHK